MPTCEVACVHEVGEVRAQLLVAVVVVSFHRRILDRAVHSLDLAIGPRMVWLGQSMLDRVGLADYVEAHLPRVCCVPVAGLFGNTCLHVWEGPSTSGKREMPCL